MELSGSGATKVLLVGNYLLDEQESMLRFCRLIYQLLEDKGFSVRVVSPKAILSNKNQGAIRRWTGYLDKYILFPFALKNEIAHADIVHICDHSNAVYVPFLGDKPNVVTCHDLLAVRAGLGEETYCPVSFLGRILQRWILCGLRQAKMIVCVSKATAADVKRLVRLSPDTMRVVHPGLNFPYQVIARQECDKRLSSIDKLILSKPYLLHVGSCEPRKNRDGIMRIFASELPINFPDNFFLPAHR